MGPFAWLASRWTPEFEYRDRLADEVEDIAYESTRIGTRRGFLMGVFVGILLVVIGIAALRISGLEPQSSATAQPQTSPEQTATPQPSSQELALLKLENERLKEDLARAKAAGGAAPREKPAAEPRRAAVKAAAPLPVQAESARSKKDGPAAARETRVAEPRPPQVKTELPTARSSKAIAPSGAVAQPIPSNCRREGECDPVSP